MSSIRTALGIITFVADIVALFLIVRKAILRCVASYKHHRRFTSPASTPGDRRETIPRSH